MLVPILPSKTSFAESSDLPSTYQTNKDVEVVNESGQKIALLEKGFLFYSNLESDVGEQIPFIFQNEEIYLDTEDTDSYQEENAPEYVEFGPTSVLKTVTSDSDIPVFDTEELQTVVASISKGTAINIIHEKEDFYSIQLGNRLAFISKKSFEKASVDENESVEQDIKNSENVEGTPTGEQTAAEEGTDAAQEDVVVTEETTEENVEATTEKINDEVIPVETEESKKEETATDEAVENKEETASVMNAKVSNKSFSTKDKYFKVSDSDVAIYDNRSGDLELIGYLEAGQVYPRVSDYGNWHRIKFGNYYGYVSKTGTDPSGNNLKNLNTSYENSGKFVTVGTDLPVYDNSSGKLVQFATIKKGQRYPIISDYGNWYRIDVSGRVGYIHKDNLSNDTATKNKFYEVLENNLPIYDNRSGSLKAVGSLKKGQVIEKKGDYGNWHKVQFNDIEGFVWKGSTRAVENVSFGILNNGGVPNGLQVKTFQDVPVYDNSSSKLVQLATIESGQTFRILYDYGNWWRVDVAGRVGYVHKTRVDAVFSKNATLFKVDQPTTPVYDNSSGKLVKVGELMKGQIYQRSRSYGRWHEINFGDGVAYVKVNTTQPASSASGGIFNNGSYKNSSKSFVTEQTVKVYDNSGKELKQFAQLDKGIRYPIVSDYGKWWRIDVSGRIGYVSKNDVLSGKVSYESSTIYDYSLQEIVDIQMNADPQTDTYSGEKAYISAAYVSANAEGPFPQSGTIIASSLNVRESANVGAHIYGKLKNGEKVNLLGYKDGWYEIELKYGWYNAKSDDVKHYVDPGSFNLNTSAVYQFLLLSKSTGIHESELNMILNGKGILEGKGKTFSEASAKYQINEIYLISHALLETGNGGANNPGQESLGTGITVTEVNGQAVTPKKVYNMYGIGAYDKCATKCGSEFAYEQDWTTPEKAIIGGAKFVADSYIHNGSHQQDTLYKMRWNPGTPGTHQYATDIGWAAKQVNNMNKLYGMLQNYTVYFDIPVYK
ncbi:mannosyl-glycoprotein endo-beta-N-acetylglucosamidase [Bacillus sp. UMB0899]|uniref:SH3 domain-containing protein n=1 Tax=Metabacillus schmidteae TaxID=2730405 RepID=UPI000C7FAC02|nr:SH3 domain-containing protein [Metabacillus schmidteae]PMC36603.1 mannosyl-glycoprotein endo-beta-N-acetylglucosamidase [Bacillus sp. UMB0899]